jgi:hypothetical protein
MKSWNAKSTKVFYSIAALIGALVANGIACVDNSAPSNPPNGALYDAFHTTLLVLSFWLNIISFFVATMFGLNGSEKWVLFFRTIVCTALGAIIFCALAWLWRLVRRHKGKGRGARGA